MGPCTHEHEGAACDEASQVTTQWQQATKVVACAISCTTCWHPCATTTRLELSGASAVATTL